MKGALNSLSSRRPGADQMGARRCHEVASRTIPVLGYCYAHHHCSVEGVTFPGCQLCPQLRRVIREVTTSAS